MSTDQGLGGLTMRSYMAFGPGEPREFPEIRRLYYVRHHWLRDLEVRISCSESGMRFLMRVRAL